MEKYCIGIDIDKKTFKVCLLYRSSDLTKRVQGSKTFSNGKEGFKEFITWISKKIKVKGVPQSYVMEATGVYHEQLAYFLEGQGKNVHIALPLKSKRYLQSLGIRSKTDKIDAKGLGMMGCEQSLRSWHPSSPALLKLRSLTRQIESLQTHRTSFLNQLESANHAAIIDRMVIKSLKTMIKQVENQITKLEKQVKENIRMDEVLRRKYKLISTIKGVGLMSFAVVVSESNGFSLFKNQRQLVCYSGYDVVENQSGQRRGKTRISKKGNSHIRRILHMASLSSVNSDEIIFRNLYQRVVDRTGIKMKGYVAVQRKLLVLIYTLWKNDMEFDPNYEISGIQESEPLFSVAPAGASGV